MAFWRWWKPKCPINYREKAWIEMRMRWLVEQFGGERLRRATIVVPTELDFSENIAETPDAAPRLFEQVCQWMDVAPTAVTLQVLPAEAMFGAAYTPGVICVQEEQLQNPVALTAAMAHELAHHILVERRLCLDAVDAEWTTDLTPLVFGLGIFAANATVTERHEHVGMRYRWAVNRQGYLPARMFGYAMALQAWLGGVERPAWIKWLRQDAAEMCRKGLDYLQATEDALLRPDNLHRTDWHSSPTRLLEMLERGGPSECLAALWELPNDNRVADALVAAVGERLNDRRPGIRAEAARTLVHLKPAAEAALPLLYDVLDDPELEVRAAAAYAVGRLQLQADRSTAELTARITDGQNIATLAWALAQYGAAARPALPALQTAFKRALEQIADVLDYLVYAIRTISPTPEEDLAAVTEMCDIELQRQLEGILPSAEARISLPPGGEPWLYWTGRFTPQTIQVGTDVPLI